MAEKQLPVIFALIISLVSAESCSFRAGSKMEQRGGNMKQRAKNSVHENEGKGG